MTTDSLRSLLVTSLLVSLFVFSAKAQTTSADGELYQLDLQTKEFIPLHQKCSVRIGPVTTELDTQHGSPRQILNFSYELLGFPSEVRSYSKGVARGMAYTVRSAQASFEPGMIAGFLGDVVYVNFELSPSQYEEFAAQPRIDNIRAIYNNPTKGYFGFSDVKWTYDCRFRE